MPSTLAIRWLGLTARWARIWNRDRINLTVTVQGDFVAGWEWPTVD